MLDFEGELNRRGVFVNKGSAAFNHFALFESKPKARKMADMAMGSIDGSQYLGERWVNSHFMVYRAIFDKLSLTIHKYI